MSSHQADDLETFMEGVKRRHPGEPEFQQAVHEVVMDIIPYIADKPKYKELKILERLTEADRIITFRVVWQDDAGNIRVNRGYRVQQNNAIGLPMGGGKGGSDFDPKGKSDAEVMRFCQAFMTELYRHVGPDTDVPAGDIGVGAREVGYMFGQYKRIVNRFEGVLTGKALEFGGSLIRTEATGYGVVYMMEDMLAEKKDAIEGKTCVVSGSGNVATYCVEKINHLGGKVVTMSDSGGFIHDPDGIDADKLAWVMELKNVRRGRISEYCKEFGGTYHEGQRPWGVPCDLAFPCATQNELLPEDARALVNNGTIAVSEGANMPTTPEAIAVFSEARIMHAPSKAANAGGVAVSGLEMSQNSLRISWTRAEVDARLREIMKSIHDQCMHYGRQPDGFIDYAMGSNVAGFIKVANAMAAYGVM